MNNPDQDREIPIVDAHHHLWDLNAISYPWLDINNAKPFFLGDYTPLIRNYLPDDYRRDSDAHNIVGTVHIEAECDRGAQVAETAWISDMSARHGFPNAIVGHVWFDRDDAEEVLAGHKAYPLFRGVRSKPVTADRAEDMVQGGPQSMQDPQWLNGFALLEKYDLSWDLRVPCWHLEEAAEVARAFPNTRIVLNHTGFPWDRSPAGLDLWRRGMAALAACPNVHVKLSCLCLPDAPWTVASNRPIILETIKTFGVDRCMFASNFPVDGLRASYDTIYSAFKSIVAGFPRAEREKLFAKNAMAFYRIEGFQ